MLFLQNKFWTYYYSSILVKLIEYNIMISFLKIVMHEFFLKENV